ncbi:MAG: thiamine phosphate synthase [Nitrospirota bacterium]|jgi:thiamine-phosphate pyrophosphorylase
MTATRSRRGFYHGGICLITDRDSCPLTVLEMARVALEAGITWIQYRDKSRDRLAAFRTAMALREVTAKHGACLVINDYADIAVAVGADGVHLGQEDLPTREARKVTGGRMIIGISTHSVEEARAAEGQGADYIGFGPVFHTETKDAGAPRGVEGLRNIRDSVGIPVVAIGGIDVDNCASVFEGGASAVAAASSVLSGDIRGNVCCFVELIEKLARSA